MYSRNRDIREYPMELISYFAHRPWDGVSIADAVARDKTGLVAKAQNCSGGMHDKTFRRDGKPAKTHPAKVVKILIYFGIDVPMILAAAFLHDAPEDNSDEILQFIEEGYPEKTFSIVFRVSRTKGMSLKEHFRLIFGDFDSILLKLADRLHNQRNMAKNVYLCKGFTKKRLYNYIRETEKFIYPLGEKISKSDYKYAKEGKALYMAVREAVNMSRLVLKVPRGVIKHYQGKRRQPTLF